MTLVAGRTVRAAVVIGLAAASVGAQGRGAVGGMITDIAGIPIAGAQFTLRALGVMTVSDSRGCASPRLLVVRSGRR